MSESSCLSLSLKGKTIPNYGLVYMDKQIKTLYSAKLTWKYVVKMNLDIAIPAMALEVKRKVGKVNCF